MGFIQRPFFLFLLFLFGCDQSQEFSGFSDLSSSKIHYHVVNLDSATDRLKLMNSQLEVAHVPYMRIPAVLGKGKPNGFFEDLVNRGILDQSTWQSRARTPGEIGLYLTTVDLTLPMARSYGDDDLSVIFEDDVIIPIDLDFQLRQALQAVPSDFDVLYLGCFQSYRANSNGSVIGPFAPFVLDESRTYGFELCPTDSLIRVPQTPWMKMTSRCVPGTWAYALTGASAQKLAHQLIPITQPIDEKIKTLIQKKALVGYCLNPELIRTNEQLPSSIR